MATVSLSLLGFYFGRWDVIAIANGLFVGWTLRINYIKTELTFIDDLFNLALVVIGIGTIFLGVLIGLLPATIFTDDRFSAIWLYVLGMICPILAGLLRQRLKR